MFMKYKQLFIICFVVIVLLLSKYQIDAACVKWDPRMSMETKSFLKQYLTSITSSSDADALWSNFDQSQDNVYRQLHPEYYSSVDEVQITGATNGNFSIPLTAFIPKQYDNSSVIFIYFHGGSFTSSDILTYRPTLTHLASVLHVRIVYIDYRKAPQNPFPVGANDCLEAAKYIIQNKNQIFPNSQNAKIAILGNSAGGNFAAFVASNLTNSSIAYQILIYPVLSLKPEDTTGGSFDKYSADQYLLPLFVPAVQYYYVQPAVTMYGTSVYTDPKLSPLYGVTPTTPKTKMIVDEFDLFRDQFDRYKQELESYNISVELNIIQGTIHSYFQLPIYFPNAFNQTVNLIQQYISNN